MAYIVVEDVNIQAFTDEVNSLLNQGWELYGSMLIAEHTYIQALILKEIEDE